jgi:hypothetical protein
MSGPEDLARIDDAVAVGVDRPDRRAKPQVGAAWVEARAIDRPSGPGDVSR